MSHKFKLGQNVRQLGITYAGNKSSVVDGLFEVVRLMPDDRSGEPCYRIKSTSCERAAREGELVLAS
ncbi:MULTISPECIES: hypothetical protein [Methylobacterium]|jgi:hypothetical protein|uniref:Uncharacterized protein n=1 Tax=Methylobacterium longum TaxID=767694 RepID=A0ABT8AW36_9HYPH|nr:MULTISPECIES: hypothetical protein [Methylobacterium]MCJ2099014.1 hypothetical protein [Methylobacterium sp. E-046]MDN3573882.1 hypothetical protein [Methylobacterium longum]GJE13841.1 hypothetical protein FOHLNKBM_4907 [Methylobacterium longum]